MKRTTARSIGSIAPWITAAALAACSGSVDPGDDDDSSGATSGSAGAPHGGAAGAANGGTGTGGTIGAGGSGGGGAAGAGGRGGGAGTGATAGVGGSAGTAGVGGSAGTGGASGSATGGTTTGGTSGVGGSVGIGSGGFAGTAAGGAGGRAGAGGRGGAGAGGTSSGGTSSGGTSSGGTSSGGTDGDPCSATTMPSGGTDHTSASAQGTAGGLSWSIWTNGSGGTITTFSVPAFATSWNNSSDFLARLGLQWGSGKDYTTLGTIKADYSEKRSGSGGGYSYIGIYGWSNNPCVEWYIVDDSYNKMPVNPGNTTNKGTAMIDGGSYTMYLRPTTGTGGSRCSGVTMWDQYYSVRQTARTCGTITISDHFKAWEAAGLQLGAVLEASILVEVGGGTGSVEFPLANVTTSM